MADLVGTTTSASRPATVCAMTGPGGRRLRVVHLTTVAMSLALLLRTELEEDVAVGLDAVGVSAPDDFVPAVERTGATFVGLPSLTRSWDLAADARAVRALARTLRDLRPDVLHTHNPKTGVLGRLVGRAVGVPVVVNTCHGLWLRPGDGWRRRTFVLGAEALAVRASHAELFQNAEDRGRLGFALGRGQGEVVGNGVDLGRFSVSAGRSPAALALRDTWGAGPDDVVVGGVGRVVAEKGVAEFAAAAGALRGRARFVWVGPDDDATARPSLADPGAVTWAGRVDDMRAVYDALDVFVLPSYREGFSRSAMEAAACGLPMVLSDIRGCREVGLHGRELLLAPAGDAASLTDEVSRLVGDPALRVRLGTQAAARARAAFDQREVAQRSLRTYARVARSKGLGWEVVTAGR